MKFAFQNEHFSDLAKLMANGVLFSHPFLTLNWVGKLDILMRIKCFQKNEKFISLSEVYTEWVDAKDRKEKKQINFT